MLGIFLIGLILSADSFSAALAMGFRPFTFKDALRFACASGGAEALSSLVGAMAGAKVVARFADVDHWIAFVLLLAVALHMLYEGIVEFRAKGDSHEGEEKKEFHSFLKILVVSFATSLDALGVGVGLGVMQDSITPYIVSIGAWAFISTLLGLYLAKKVSTKYASIASITGAIILIGISIKMLEI
ncbi:manganese efflux pump [Bacteriovorax sp. Seq25_V]|uniref:manganese efflux pump MntP n=1 Tax=Bacteriovorax sp. Seq25_V TaxID=1201288 RepID=UPI000389F6E7|nr:manganese efflux pump [Bacteriovorax sp. Seq25_V]EQC47444.1 PF02659 domain protein [Bacteriovorax sp. Seq25_V]